MLDSNISDEVTIETPTEEVDEVTPETPDPTPEEETPETPEVPEEEESDDTTGNEPQTVQDEFQTISTEKPVKLPDGRTLSWKELEGEMLLKQKYTQRVNELNEAKQQHEKQLSEYQEFVNHWQKAPIELVAKLANSLGLKLLNNENQVYELPPPGQDYASQRKQETLQEQNQTLQQQIEANKLQTQLQSEMYVAQQKYGDAITNEVNEQALDLWGNSQLSYEQCVGYVIGTIQPPTQPQPPVQPKQPEPKPKRQTPSEPTEREEKYNLSKYGL